MYLTFDSLGNLIESHDDQRINSYVAPSNFELQKWNARLVNNVVVILSDEELQLLTVRKNKLTEMSYFFKVTARIMQIQDGAIQNIIVDQDFANNINSALKQAQESGVYFHRLRDNQGNAVIGENGLPILIKITLDGLNKISNKIELRRGYCACAEVYHRTKINSLTSIAEIENYNYLTDDLGNPYQAAAAIILNEEGDVL